MSATSEHEAVIETTKGTKDTKDAASSEQLAGSRNPS